MNVLRQVTGETKGIKPSITRTRAKASQKVVLSKLAPGLLFGTDRCTATHRFEKIRARRIQHHHIALGGE